MTWEETPKDLEAYQAALDAQAASGVDSRIAEGRARSKAVRTWRAANPEEAAKLEKAPKAPAAAAAGGNGAEGAPAAVPAAAPAAVGAVMATAAAVTTPVREAPLPTG